MEIRFENIDIKKHFRKILISCRHIDRLFFVHCKLDTKDLKLGNTIEYKYDSLHFNKCKFYNAIGKDENIDNYIEIFKAIKSST